MTKTTAPRVRAEKLYAVELDGKPVAQAMAISQAEAVRLYVESVLTARLSSPLEARTLAGLPLLQREPAAVDTKTADLFEATPAADHVEDILAMVEPLAAGGFAPCGRALGDCGKATQTCGRDGCGVELAEMPPQPGEPAELVQIGETSSPSGLPAEFLDYLGGEEVAAAPQGEPMPSAPSTAAPTVSTSAATPESPAHGRPTAAAGAATDAPEKTAGESSPTAASAEVEPHRSTAADDEPRRRLFDEAPKGAGKVVAKYRNPADGSTWSGRGLKPKWLLAALEAGQSQDEFLIEPA